MLHAAGDKAHHMGEHLPNTAAQPSRGYCTNYPSLIWPSYNLDLQNTGTEIWFHTGCELFLFNNDCVILTLVITDWKSELCISGTILILQMQKHKNTFTPKKGSSYHIWKTLGEQ